MCHTNPYYVILMTQEPRNTEKYSRYTAIKENNKIMAQYTTEKIINVCKEEYSIEIDLKTVIYNFYSSKCLDYCPP